MGGRRKLLLGALLALIVLGITELFAFAFVILRGDLFQHGALANLQRQADPDKYARFLEASYDPDLGWDNRQPLSRDAENCLGQSVRYTFNEWAGRETGSAAPFDILVVGDSYTFGHEANDEESYPYRLAELTGRSVGNFGVGGYGPYQAVLKFERLLQTHPGATVAILGITYENIRRMPNRFRLAYHNSTGLIYSFKPYIDIEHEPPSPRPNPNAPPADDLAGFLGLAEQALAEDYWRRPKATFPFTLSVIRLPFSRIVREDLLKKPRRLMGGADYAEYENGPARSGLTLVIERFLQAARGAGMKPVVLFKPMNAHDTTSPGDLVTELRRNHPDAMIIDIGEAPVDWTRYNLDETACHPSAYGYDQIAQSVARRLDESR